MDKAKTRKSPRMFLTITEASEELDVSEDFVRDLIAQGALNCFAGVNVLYQDIKDMKENDDAK